MEAVEPMTPLAEARETEASTEVGEQSILWRRHKENLGQQNRTEIPCEETGGSPQFKRARLEEFFEDEQEKTREDETEQIGLENILRTKSEGRPNSSTASSFLGKNVSVIAKYHFINCPTTMFPYTKKRNVFNGVSG